MKFVSIESQLWFTNYDKPNHVSGVDIVAWSKYSVRFFSINYIEVLNGQTG